MMESPREIYSKIAALLAFMLKGCVSISYINNKIPADHMSIFSVYCSLFRRSGAMNASVPANLVVIIILLPSTLNDTLKSVITNRGSSSCVIKMFYGLRSR